MIGGRGALLLVLSAMIAFFAGPGDRRARAAGLCSVVPFASLRDTTVAFFVATAKPDTVAAGQGRVRPSSFGGHWGPASDRAIYGQAVTVHQLRGFAAGAAESAFARSGAREAVLIPWDYDAGCQAVPWARSARWVSDGRTGFYRARPRATAEWIDDRPTYDVFRADIEPYPHGLFFQRGYRGSDSAQAADALTAAEYFNLYEALPDRGEATRDPTGALRRLADWEASHPGEAGRFPATRVLQSARNVIGYLSRSAGATSQ